MAGKHRSALAVAGIGFAAAVSSWVVYAAVTWLRYGRPKSCEDPLDADPLLDRFIPVYEVAERHSTLVDAPAETTFAAACALDLQESKIVRALFGGRARLLGAARPKARPRRPLLSWATTLGWGVLAQAADQEMVLGAVTRPWEGDVIFRSISPEDFAAFHEPGYVKIVWNVRTDPIAGARSVARTETRVVATDPAARAKFRLYWAFLSPGILLMRYAALRMVKKAAAARSG